MAIAVSKCVGWISVLEQMYFGGSNFSYNNDDGSRWMMAHQFWRVCCCLVHSTECTTEVIQRNSRTLAYGDS